MNDTQIREGLHRKVLWRHHRNKKTLVLDELGLRHGLNRADVAVVNGHLIGYEIKSDEDSLHRLEEQVVAYTAVFDWVSVVIGTRHEDSIEAAVPACWGIILSNSGQRGAVHFTTLRPAKRNTMVDPTAIAHLLWRNEAVSLLADMGSEPQVLRKGRAVLYEHLVERLSLRELQGHVRACLKSRKNWRHQSQPSPSGGLFRPIAK